MGDGTRSGLWSEIVRLVGELRPRYVILENVANLLAGPSEQRGGWFGRVLSDLAECGYDAEWENIPASALGAPHRRERVWIVAYPSKKHQPRGASFQATRCGIGGDGSENKAISEKYKDVSEMGDQVPNPNRKRGRGGDTKRQDAKNAREQPICTGGNPRRVEFWDVEPDVGRVAHGVPGRTHRLAGLGNAVVPQIPEMIGYAILEAERETK